MIVQNKTNKVLICLRLPCWKGKAVCSISHSYLHVHVVRVLRHLINVSKKGEEIDNAK